MARGDWLGGLVKQIWGSVVTSRVFMAPWTLSGVKGVSRVPSAREIRYAWSVTFAHREFWVTSRLSQMLTFGDRWVQHPYEDDLVSLAANAGEDSIDSVAGCS